MSNGSLRFHSLNAMAIAKAFGGRMSEAAAALRKAEIIAASAVDKKGVELLWEQLDAIAGAVATSAVGPSYARDAQSLQRWLAVVMVGCRS